MAKPDAKSEPKPKPKRDPNQPLPKPKKRGRLVAKVLVGGVLLLVGVWGALFYMEKGRMPWDDPGEFANFSRDQVNEAVASVDWEALKGKITAQTRKLYESVPDLERKLDATLARLRGGQAGEAGQPGAEGAAATGGEGGQPAAVVQNARPSTYEQGCQSLRDAMQTYKRSVPSGKGDRRSDAELQRELKSAKGQFEKARDQLEKAHGEAEAAGDQTLVNEIEEVLMQCNTYLEDCSKRQTL